MSFNPAAMGLVSPIQAAPSGAVNEDAAPPADVMEAPAFAADEATIAAAQEVAPTTLANPAGWLAAPVAQSPVAQSPGSQGQSSADIWESPDNPYKRAAQANQPDPVRELNSALRALPQQAETSYHQLIASGYNEPTARAMVGLASQAASAEINRQLTEHLSMPAAKQMVAADIAQRMSLPGVTIDPRDLLRESSVEGMQARARTLVETRRTATATQRVATRVDVAENSGGVAGGSSVANQGLSPFETIKAGLRSSRR